MDWMEEEAVKTLKRLQSENTNDKDDFAYCMAIAAIERMVDIEALNKELQKENQKFTERISKIDEMSLKNAQVIHQIVQENINLKRQLEELK